MKKETLLQKAQKIGSKKNIPKETTDEHLELAFAWLKDEIGLRQISAVIGVSYTGGSSLYRIAVYLKEAYKRGLIKIKK